MSKKKKKYMKEVTEETNEARETSETIESSQPNESSEASQASESSETSATEEEKLLAALAEADEKYNDLHDKYLRQMAEFENFRKRTIKEKSELILNGSAKLMTAVLPILDDMDRALDAMEKSEDEESCREGFKLIAGKFRSTLEQNGLKQIETEGQAFDTDFHEAIAMIPAADESQKGQVIDCVQPGYKLNDKVIRHSKVVVAN